MASLARVVANRIRGQRADPFIPFQSWVDAAFSYNGLNYTSWPNTSLANKQEEIAGNFASYVHGAFQSNGIVFACMVTRMLLLSEARFQYRRFENGRPTDFFGKRELAILDNPRDLIARASLDVDVAGNWYGHVNRGQINRLRPDWVTILLGSQTDEKNASDAHDAEVVAYIYTPGGVGSGNRGRVLLPETVAHWAPIKDPMSRFKGVSWLSPIVQEIIADKAAMTHKQMFFENGATANLTVSLDKAIGVDDFNDWVDAFEQEHAGLFNAYRTLYFGGGADAKVIGANLRAGAVR